MASWETVKSQLLLNSVQELHYTVAFLKAVLRPLKNRPTDAKYRRLNKSYKPFQEHVSQRKGGEAFLAGQAFAAPTHLITFGYQARVDHLGVMGTTERTMHAGFPERIKNGLHSTPL